MLTTLVGFAGWLAVGLSVGLASMILPFKRGSKGIILNALIGIAGALAGGAAGYGIGLYDRMTHADALGCAAVGSLLTALLAHALPLHNTQRHSEK